MDATAEYLDYESEIEENEENIIIDHDGNAPIESSVLENDQQLIEQQYSSVTQLTLQRTTEYSYVQYSGNHGFYNPEMAEPNTNVYNDFSPTDDLNYKRSLVIAAIGQLEKSNDESHQHAPENEQICGQNFDAPMSPSTNIQSADITTTDEFLMDIQAEVNVETSHSKANDDCENYVGPTMKESEILLRSKRKRKQTREFELFMKELNAKTKSKPKTPSNIEKSKEKEDRKRSLNCTGNFAIQIK